MSDDSLASIIDRHPVTVDRHATLIEAIAAMKQANFTVVWVTESTSLGQRLVGTLSPQQLIESGFSIAANEASLPQIEFDRVAAQLAEPSLSVQQGLAYFRQQTGDYLPLVDQAQVLVGVINKHDLHRYYYQQSQAVLEQSFQTCSEGFSLMMLDEPIAWQTTADKAAAIDYAFHHQRITHVNEALLLQYDAQPEEILGTTPADLYADNIVYGKSVWQAFFDLGFMSETTQVKRGDAEEIWVEGCYTCLYDEAGRIIGHFGLQRDITQHKQVESLLRCQERYLYVIVAMQQKLLALGNRMALSCDRPHAGSPHPTFSPELEAHWSNGRETYQDILQQLGEAADAARVYLIETQTAGILGEPLVWCQAGRALTEDALELRSPLQNPALQRWLKRLSGGEHINCCIQDLPAPEHAALAAQDVQTVLILPLMVSGQFWGFIGFDDCEKALLWDESEVILLSAAAAAISMHLENCLAFRTMHQSWHREQLTYQLVEKIHQSLQLDDIFAVTTDNLQRLLGCDRTLIYRFNSDWSGSFVAESVGAAWPPISELESPVCPLDSVDQFQHSEMHPKERGRSLFATDAYLQETQGEQFRRGKAFSQVNDVSQAGFGECYLDSLRAMQAQAYLVAPLFVGKRLWGLVGVYQNLAPRQWNENDVNLLLHITAQLGIALQHVELLEQTRHQALELAQAKTTAEAATQAKSKFWSGVSHELRTPLNAILGFSQVLRDEIQPTDDDLASITQAEYASYIDIIHRNGHYLLNLINNVLEMARFESGQAEVQVTNFDLEHLLNRAEAAIADTAEQKGLHVSVQLDSRLPRTIDSDADKLFHVITNLLKNAVEFTHSGSITLRAGVYGKTQVGTTPRLNLVFEVEDTGPGISEEELGTLFQPFIKPRIERSSEQGAGLGLAVSRQYANLLGGDISVSSQIGHGSRFKFNIWATTTDAAVGASIPQVSLQASTTSPLPNAWRLLIVQKHAQDNYHIAQMLSPLGCDLRTATNESDALALTTEWQPHLVLVDLAFMATSQAAGIAQLRQPQITPRAKEATKTPPKLIALVSAATDRTLVDVHSAAFDDVWRWPTAKVDLQQQIVQQLTTPSTALAEPVKMLAASSAASPHDDSLRSSLIETSVDWQQQVYQAAITGADETLIDLIEQLAPEKDALATTLVSLTENFQFDKIIALLPNE